MPSTQQPVEPFAVLPDPGRATTIDGLVERLRLLKVWAGDPSYEGIKDRINAAWAQAGRPAGEAAGKTTVVNCFRAGRRRLNPELVVAVVWALHPDAGYVAQWRQALQVIGGRTQAATQVRVQDRLPEDLAGFTGRSAMLDRLRRSLCRSEPAGDAVTVSAIAGMAGVGKTQLAIHAGHRLLQERRVDRVLFVNLRGFHADPGQPPADPAAVLDGFLRLLGVPGQQIPHDLPARAATYRRLLTGTRTLVVLDDAAGADQVRPLLTGTPGCPVLITSRRSLAGLRPVTHVTVDVFTPGEAAAFLTRAVPGAAVGPDPDAGARIARRCGHLPLALGLVTAHIRATPAWTLTDHADRLDERHHQRRLETGVELALDLSHQHLPADEQRLLRLVALHPGQDFDAHAAAALTDTDLRTVQIQLGHLHRDHLLQRRATGRYNLHDLVRDHATGRAGDEDSPPQRRAALTRLFDFYVPAAATAMDTLYPADAHRRPRAPEPGTPVHTLTDPDGARTWLDTERSTLVAVAAHTATHGWPAHTARLSTTLFRYLNGGYLTEALAIHGHARDAAHGSGDPRGQAHALTSLGATYTQLARYGPATDHLQQAMALFRQAGDRNGEARALTNLGVLDSRMGRNQPAADHFAKALTLFRQTGHRAGEAHALNNLGEVEGKLGRHGPATERLSRALTLFRRLGDRAGEAWTLNSLGEVEVRLCRYTPASDHLQQALTLYRQLGDRAGEDCTLDNLATLHTRLGQAAGQHQHALALFREIGDRCGEASTLNSLGEAAHTTGRPADAVAHHTAAHTIAVDIGAPDQQARAHSGLGHAYRTLADLTLARRHYRRALTLYLDLGLPEADEIRVNLATIDQPAEVQHGRSPTMTSGQEPAVTAAGRVAG